MTSRVRKAVIPAAGLGTRFLPVTKSVPKELLPILTTPTLHMVIEEAADSGIEEVILVTSDQKQPLNDYFSMDNAYARELESRGKRSMLEQIDALLRRVRVTTARQDNPRGLGHAIQCAEKAVAGEPFVIILPDVLIVSNVPCCRQLIDAYAETGCSLSATEHTPRSMLHLYGVYDIGRSEGRVHWARGVVEKPKAEEAPSDFSVVGRYLFHPEVFKVLSETKPGKGNEIQLADAMHTLATQDRMVAYEYEGRQFDTGDPLSFLKANISFGMQQWPDELTTFLREMLTARQGS